MMSFAQVCGWHVLENLYLPIFLHEIYIEICLFYTKCKASFRVTGGDFNMLSLLTKTGILSLEALIRNYFRAIFPRPIPVECFRIINIYTAFAYLSLDG